MRWGTRALGVLFLSVLVTACGTQLTAENLSKIEAGMSEEEVRSILGKPTEIEMASFLGFSGTSWSYRKGESEAKVVFVNGQVFQKSGNLK